MKTAVSQVPVPMEEHAALCLVETDKQKATCVCVPLATQVLVALMTQMNVLPHPLYARTKELVSTPLAPSSETISYNNPMRLCTLNY